jgi:hypothetical protein
VEEFFVAQYLPDGSLDSAFGNDGIAYVDFSAYEDTCTSLTIQPDGRIVAAGYTAIPQFPLAIPTALFWQGSNRTAHLTPASARAGSLHLPMVETLQPSRCKPMERSSWSVSLTKMTGPERITAFCVCFPMDHRIRISASMAASPSTPMAAIRTT